MLFKSADSKDVIKGTARSAKTVAAGWDGAFNKVMNKADNTRLGKTIFQSLEKITAKIGPKITKLGAKAIPVAGWALLIADASVAISTQMGALEKDLKKDYEGIEATVGAGSAGFLSAMTLGLLPKSVYAAFGGGTAAVTKSLRGLAKDLEMDNLFDSVLKSFKGTIKTFQGLGDILLGIFTGDSDKISKGFGNIFKGLILTITGLPRMFGSALLDVGPLILKGIIKWLEFLTIDSVIAVVDMVKGIGKAFKKGFTSLAGAWDKDGIAGIGDALVGLFSSPFEAVKTRFNGFMKWIGSWAERLGLKVDILTSKFPGGGNEKAALAALAKFDKAQKIQEEQEKAAKEAAKKLKASDDASKKVATGAMNWMGEYNKMVGSVSSTMDSVGTANATLDAKKMRVAKPILDAMKGFKGGKIEVSHNLPNTKIELTVNIDSKKLAEALVAIDLGKTPASTSPNDRTYLGTQKGQTKLPGSA